jgi:hypothetical protein
VQTRLVRLIVLFLAVVFFIGAADPTPRFLGLPRLGDGPELPSKGEPKARPVTHDYDLPNAVSRRERPQSLGHHLSALTRTLPSGEDLARVFLSAVAPRVARLATTHSFTPPLRL